MASCVFILAISGVVSRIFKVGYNGFIIIHKLSFFTIYIAAFIHGAYKVFYFGIFWLWLDLIVFRGITIIINRYALQDMVLEPIGDKYVKISLFWSISDNGNSLATNKLVITLIITKMMSIITKSCFQ